MIIIAESASNHNGDMNNLMQLANASKISMADYFTVQVINKDYFCDKTYSSKQVIEKICFNQREWKSFFKFCKKDKIKIIPCPADINSLKFVFNEGFKLIKLHGSDILNTPMLNFISKHDVKILLETQLATERDIDFAIKKIGFEKISCLMHGYSNYPTEGEELNLNALDFMRNKWNLEIGFADHSTETSTIPAMAIAKGVNWIEKHITLSRNSRNYDWQASLEPEDFATFVLQMKKYNSVLGKTMKHPTKSEYLMRQTMYKKFVHKNNRLSVIRSDKGQTFHDYTYSKYDKKNIITAVIGRLKSTRLKKKLLLNFVEDKVVFDLLKYVDRSKFSKKTILATSYLNSDDELVNEAKKRKINVFRGHPENVLDRLISLGEQEKAFAIFRITADMPFADPELMDEMVKLFQEKKLDYVRAMNCPLGFSAELFSLNYLQKLYQSIDDPNQSEYLGWYVTVDQKARKGCIKLKYNNIDLSQYSLTIDYQEDLESCIKLVKKINKDLDKLRIVDIISNLRYLKKIEYNKKIKMPHNTLMKYGDYIDMQWKQGFNFYKDYIIK